MNEKIKEVLAMGKSNLPVIVEKGTMVLGALVGILVVFLIQKGSENGESYSEPIDNTSETLPE